MKTKLVSLSLLYPKDGIIKWINQNILNNVDSRLTASLSGKDIVAEAGGLPQLLTVLNNFSVDEIISKGISVLSGQIKQIDIETSVKFWDFSVKGKSYIYPENQWLIVASGEQNETVLKDGHGNPVKGVSSIRFGDKYISLIPPLNASAYKLSFVWSGGRLEGADYLLKVLPEVNHVEKMPKGQMPSEVITREDLLNMSVENVVTIGAGTSAISSVPLAGVKYGNGYLSKYNALLMANLQNGYPNGDRFVAVKGSHESVKVNGQWFDLDISTFHQFQRYPLPTWQYKMGEGKDAVIIEKTISMIRGENSTVVNYKLVQGSGVETFHVRPHIVARSFHQNQGDGRLNFENSWGIATNGAQGFGIDPVQGLWGNDFKNIYKGTYALANKGSFNHVPEGWYPAHHPIESARGQADQENFMSPGFFEVDLNKDKEFDIAYTVANTDDVLPQNRSGAFYGSENLSFLRNQESQRLAGILKKLPEDYAEYPLLAKLAIASDLFIADREGFKTVIAGFPWFTDWGRDTFIAARGLIKAGMTDEVKGIIIRFAQFEENGTLPNIILGATAGNRETVDAPLMYFAMLKEYIEATSDTGILDMEVEAGKTIKDVLNNIISGYQKGVCIIKRYNHRLDIWEHKFVNYEDGVDKEDHRDGQWSIAFAARMDKDSGLIQSSSHSTWMDTNEPAGTPREGYPVEIQAMWYNAINYISELTGDSEYVSLAAKVKDNFNKYFWNDSENYLYDSLKAGLKTSAENAIQDPAFRSNMSMAVTFGLLDKEKAQKMVSEMYKKLVTPSGIRSLAEGSVSADGFGYQAFYAGDEDTQRKLAYHNGTVWSHPLGWFVLAYLKAFDNDQKAVKEMLSLFETVKEHLREAGIGNISEVMDGNNDGTRHIPRGCTEQAWGATELFRAYATLIDLLQD